jgi:hypothetical protein
VRAAGLDLASFRAEVFKIRHERPDSVAQEILDELLSYADTLAAHLQLAEPLVESPSTV